MSIADKERQIYELKKKNQELEKFKFVLDFKIKELKQQIEPREAEIGTMKKQIKEVRARGGCTPQPARRLCACTCARAPPVCGTAHHTRVPSTTRPSARPPPRRARPRADGRGAHGVPRSQRGA